MLTFSQLVSFAGAVSPGDAPTALRARLQHMQRLGFPAGVNFPKGERRRVSYDLDKILLTGVALALMESGASTARAVSEVKQGVAQVRGVYSAAAAVRYAGIGDAPPPLMLAERAYVDGHSTTRFDAVPSAEGQAVATILFAAVIINVDAMLAEIERLVPQSRARLAAQAGIVGDLAGSRLLDADEISHLLADER